MNDILTLEEVAAYLRVSERTVITWAEKGELPGGKLGTSWRFVRTEIEYWVKQKLTSRYSIDKEVSFPLSSYLTPERTVRLACSSKKEILNAMVDLCTKLPGVKNREQLAQAVLERETLMSTGIGLSIAVPHVRLNSVKDLFIAFAVNDKGIGDYESLDNQPVRIVVLILAGRDQHTRYIKMLSKVASILKEELIREQLYAAADPTEIYSILMEGDKRS